MKKRKNKEQLYVCHLDPLPNRKSYLTTGTSKTEWERIEGGFYRVKQVKTK